MLNPQTRTFVARFMRAYPGRTALLVLLLVLSGLAEGIGVVTMLPLLEMAVPSGGHGASELTRVVTSALAGVGLAPTLEVLLLLIVGGMLLKGGFRLLAMKQVGYTVAYVTTDMRLQLLRALLQTRWSYFTHQPTGRFANAINTEASRAAGAYRSACAMIASGVQVLMYTAIALLVSPQVAVLAIFAGGVIVLVLHRLVGVMRAAGGSQTELMASLSARLTDALQGIKPIKAMAREAHLQPLLENETQGLNEAQEKQVLASEAMMSAQEPLLVIMLAGGLYFALTIGNQPFSTLLMMAFVFNRLAGRISLLQMDYQSIALGESAFWSMTSSIEAAAAQREATGSTVAPPPLRSEISLEEVSFSYGERPVLDRISLTVPAGRFVVIAGPSGAGKTTIADLIVGLHHPQRGAVRVDGVPLSQLDLIAWRRQIGYVPQEMFLFHDSLFHNVTLGDPEISREAVEEALRAAGAWEFVARLPEGVDTVMGERGSKLSGGQRQRIAIARALARRPRLLVLDEVTTSLDPQTEASICNTLRELRGLVTIVGISHQPAMMQAADLVYQLEDGRVRTVRAPAELSAATA